MKKYILWLILAVGLYLTVVFVQQAWFHGVEPNVSANLAVSAVNGGATEYAAQRSYEENKGFVDFLFGILRVACVLFGAFAIYKMVRHKKPTSAASSAAVAVMLMFVTIGLTGCGRQPYDTPEFKEIGTNQTAYVIPVSDVKNQVKFDSAYLESKKQVAVRRIQIPHEWVQTARKPWYMSYAPGEYKPTVQVIVLDRTPIMREWSSDPQSMGGGKSDGVNVESSDSIGFSLGFKVVAFVSEEDASTFLYMNPSGSLASVMDTEVLTRIQKIAARECARYTMDECRRRKGDIYRAIDEDVIPFFKQRGITITTIGQLGGFIYDNARIQEAIDQTVVDQQLKVSAIAKAEAQLEDNKRIESKATAEANAARSKGQADADATFYVQKATADGIREVAKATSEAQSGEAYMRLKELEVALEWAKHSQGNVPQFVITGGSNGEQPPVNFLMSLPPDYIKPPAKK